MSRDGSVTFPWGDGKERRFRLPFAQLHDLEETRNCSALDILARLRSSRPRVMDVRDIIRLGLIGGGVSATETARLVQIYVGEEVAPYAVTPAPSKSNAEAALFILAAGLFGVTSEADEIAGKAPAEPSETAPVESASAPPPTTAPEP